MDILYKNIKSRRETLGLSQETLAQKVGYTSRSSIAKIENGEVDIPLSKIIAFAKSLHCTPMELMGWENKNGIPLNEDGLSLNGKASISSDETSVPPLSDDEKQLLDAYRLLSDHDKKNILSYTRFLSIPDDPPKPKEEEDSMLTGHAAALGGKHGTFKTTMDGLLRFLELSRMDNQNKDQ